MKLTDCLSEQSKELWPSLYKKFTKRVWKPPKKDKRGITCEVKIDVTERELREKPNYTIEEKGR
jgi:hypothetical protein